MSGNSILGLIYLGIVIASLYGWVANIVTIFHSDFGVLSGVLILRVVGIFVPPLGVVMGYL